ncbi:MAG: patatin-like phospholipase family protein, partial [Candidatus Berkiella sp.]
MTLTHGYDLSVFVLQGGGALGSYQLGVLEGLLEQGCQPDWIIGTSIGAINAAIIAGNHPENRIQKLKQFWQTISTPSFLGMVHCQNNHLRRWQNFLSGQWSMCFGQPGFFAPRFFNPWQLFFKGSPDKLSFYDTKALEETLQSVIDFDFLNE